MPEISLPDIRLPDIRFRDGKLPDVKLPDIDLREHLPDVDLSKLPLPAAFRDFSMPDVHIPEVRIPDLRDLKAPKVDVALPDPRRLDLSGLDAKRLRSLAPFMKPAPKPASPLPWIVIAGAVGLFAGWFLATSPMARATMDRLRARMGAWQGRGEWEDAEERAEGFWSNEQGWQQEGSERGQGSGSGTGTGTGSWESTASTGSGEWQDASNAAAVTGGEEEVGGTGYEPSGDGGNRESEREG